MMICADLWQYLISTDDCSHSRQLLHVWYLLGGGLVGLFVQMHKVGRAQFAELNQAVSADVYSRVAFVFDESVPYMSVAGGLRRL